MFKLLGGVAAGLTALGTLGGVAAPANAASPANPPSVGSAGSGKGSAGNYNCNSDAHWPAYVQGQPDGFDARDDGVYLWHNPTGGWGLRVSHPLLPGHANRVVFTGTITSRGKIGNVSPVKNEKDDVVKVGPKGHTLRFRFVDYGGVDGINFTTTCTPGLQVNLKADRTSVQPRYVHLGDKKVSPGSDPFRIRRHDRDTATLPVPQKGSSTHGTGRHGSRGGAAAPPNAAQQA